MTRKSASGQAKSARTGRKSARPLRANKPDAIAALVTASAQVLALPIDPAWHAGVTFNLQLIFKHAALIEAFALPDETEPAPVFRA